MPDRYDPKLSVRPPGERKAAEAPSDSDPLAELARIVSGRPPFEPAPAGKAGKALPTPVQPEPDVERDLEAELLNDLQASFAAIREPLESVGATVADTDSDAAPEPEVEPEPPPPPPPAPVRAGPPPRLQEPRIAPPRRPEPVSFDISQAIDQAIEEVAHAPIGKAPPARPDGVRPYVPPLRGPASPQPRDEPPAREFPLASRPAPPVRADHAPAARNEPAPPKAERAGASQSGGERPSLLRRVVAPRSDRPNLPVRPLSPDEERLAAEPPVLPRAIAPKPLRVEPAPPPSRFAPPPRAAVAPPAPPRRQAVPEPVVEPPLEEDLDLADLASDLEGPFEDEFTLDDLDEAAYAQEDEFPPFPEEEIAGLKRRRKGRVFAVVVGLLAIVAIGGAAVFLYRNDATGSPPPIIAADSGPTKVPPDESGAPAETDSQGKLIYDRVDGSDTTLVTGEAEIGDIPAADADVNDNPISRVIIPGGPGVDAPATDGGGETMVAEADPSASGEDSDIGPRMVRTVVVKPDGTIVSSEATGVDADGNALPEPEETDGGVVLPDPGRTEMDAVLEGGDLAVNADPLSNPLPPVEAPEAPEAEAIPTPPAADETPAALRKLPSPQPEPPAAEAAPEPAAPEPVQPAAAPEPAAPPPPAQTQVATRTNDNGPINLTPGTAPAAGAPQATGGGGVLVQVTAQRSEESAVSAYRSLQQRYPSILGAFQPTIMRADLGDRGVYYRVRVGPFSNGDAARLCDDLKAAGGDCILAR